MKAYIEFNRGPNQPSVEHKRPLKANILDVYYDKLYIDYYHFCQ